MKPRCAIVECYNRHDEVYLTTVRLMDQLGYDVHVFNTLRNRLKNSFVYAPHLRRQIHSRLGSAAVLAAVLNEKYDLVVFNTLEGAAVLDCARKILRTTPIIGFIHNAGFVTSKPEYREFIGHRHCKFAVLAPYIARHLAEMDAAYMYPVFFNDAPIPVRRRSGQGRRFCVQGYFDSTRRQYGVLLQALQQLQDEARSGFQIHIMGRSFSEDFATFNGEIKRRGLSPLVRYTWKGVGYRTYYTLLNSVDFVLPLISPDSHPGYFKSKSTSSVAAAIGFGKVPILHQTLSELYGVADASFKYTDDLTAAMRSALDATDSQLARLTGEVVQIKQLALEQSMQQLRQSIAQISV